MRGESGLAVWTCLRLQHSCALGLCAVALLQRPPCSSWAAVGAKLCISDAVHLGLIW